MTNGTLLTATQELTANELVVNLKERWIVFVSTPSEFVVAIAQDGQLRRPEEPNWPLPVRTFQIQAFDGTSEVRWIASSDAGRMAWISEDRQTLPSTVLTERPFCDHIDTSSVLWGNPGGETDEVFSRWTTARVGTAHYAVAAGTNGQRAVLTAREYIHLDEHGNASIFERRLITINVRDLKGRREDTQ